MKQEQYILINKYGNKFYYKDREMTTRHRIDGPAVEWSDGSKEWWVDGKKHRLDGPAYEQANGSKAWYVDGKLHRLDGSAIEQADGYKEWYVEGQLHRLDGPAVIYADGSKEWYVDDIRHRLDGPAIEYAGGEKSWYVDGKRHRLDGPAVEWPDGDKEWWVDGEYLTEEQFNALSAPTLEENPMNKVTSISELLTNYERTLDPFKKVEVVVDGHRIDFASDNMTTEEIQKQIDSLTTFLQSKEGQMLIPKRKN